MQIFSDFLTIFLQETDIMWAFASYSECKKEKGVIHMEAIKISGTGLKLQPAKKREEIKQISAKLHPDYDKELMDLIRQIPKRERSKVYRDAVMEYLKNE